MSAAFSVLVITAPPPGLSADGSGALVKIDGREALLRSVELFLNRDNVKQVQVVVSTDKLEEAKRKYGPHFGFSGVKLLSAGDTWMSHVAAATGKISDEATHVILHDAARPAVSYADIDAIMDAAEKHPAVALTAPLRSALVETDEGGNPVAIHSPSRYLQLLTPQCFNKARFEQMASSNAEPHASEYHLVPGSALNLRVGGSGDAGLAKAIINMLPKPKSKPPSSPFEEAQW